MAAVFLSLDGRPGSRAPHVWVMRDGKKKSTIDLFGSNFVLLTGSDGQPWKRAVKAMASELGIDLAVYSIGPKGDLVDEKDKFLNAAGVSSKGAFLVRPYGFVAWRTRRQPSDHQESLTKVMKQALCLEV